MVEPRWATSPYLIREAKRLKIGAPQIGCSVGALADHRAGDYRFARDQREAGIEHHTWIDRIKPPRPYLYYLAAAMAWAIFAISLVWSAIRFAGA
jgi:hypothetical protein